MSGCLITLRRPLAAGAKKLFVMTSLWHNGMVLTLVSTTVDGEYVASENAGGLRPPRTQWGPEAHNGGS